VTREIPLSARESQVAGLYADGATYRIIAKQLFVAPATVRSHLASIYRKLGLSSKLELKARLDGDLGHHTLPTDRATAISELGLGPEGAISRGKMAGAVLDIISKSNGDIDTVFKAILAYLLNICDAESGFFMDYRGDGRYCMAYSKGVPKFLREWLEKIGEFTAHPQSRLRHLAEHLKVINVIDARTKVLIDINDPIRKAMTQLGGARSMMAIPMLVDDVMIGTFTIFRQDVRPFTPEVAKMATIFMGQSVIATSNARTMSALRENTNMDKSNSE
jgi:DNA-binding CsgD family transcriptional regulator